MFKVGDLAVYPAHGVGVIERVESREVSGSSQDFYVMRILENDMIIMIPIKNVNNVGLREIIGRKEVPKLYNILKKRDVMIENQTWNRRYREYMEKIKTGSVYEVAEVYRDLLMLKSEKGRERRRHGHVGGHVAGRRGTRLFPVHRAGRGPREGNRMVRGIPWHGSGEVGA